MNHFEEIFLSDSPSLPVKALERRAEEIEDTALRQEARAKIQPLLSGNSGSCSSRQIKDATGRLAKEFDVFLDGNNWLGWLDYVRGEDYEKDTELN